MQGTHLWNQTVVRSLEIFRIVRPRIRSSKQVKIGLILELYPYIK